MTLIVNIFYLLFLPLVLTIFIELSIWKLLQLTFKKFDLKYIWLSIIAINILTNPLLNILTYIFDSSRRLMFLEIGFEIIIIFVEAAILYFIYKEKFSKFLLLSTIINIFSYGIGLILFTPVWI